MAAPAPAALTPTTLICVDEQDCKVSVTLNYLSPSEEQALFTELTSLSLIKHRLKDMFGKPTYQPRLSICLNRAYSYSGVTHPSIEWSPLAKHWVDKINADYATDFNSGMVNYYPTGKDYISPHSDDEQSLAANGGVYGISTGSQREMVMRWLLLDSRKPDPAQAPISIPLPPGSLFAMEGETQKRMTHGMPVRTRAGPRASLTARKFAE